MVKSRGPGRKAKKGASPLAPSAGDILGRAFLALMPEDHPDCNLTYFQDTYFPARGVIFQTRENFLIAAVIDESMDEGRARNMIQIEAGADRGNKPIRRHVSVRRFAPFVDPADKVALCVLVHEHKKVTTVEELRFLSKEPYPRGGIYIVWDENECFYIGISQGDPVNRADQHFSRNGSKATPFDKYCRVNLRETMPWKVHFIDPDWCDSIARKALFWDRQEYEEHMPRVEEAYREKVETKPLWFLHKAESALIALYQPHFNVGANIHRPPQKPRTRIQTT